jgi:hypothetical protein
VVEEEEEMAAVVVVGGSTADGGTGPDVDDDCCGSTDGCIGTAASVGADSGDGSAINVEVDEDEDIDVDTGAASKVEVTSEVSEVVVHLCPLQLISVGFVMAVCPEADYGAKSHSSLLGPRPLRIADWKRMDYVFN